MPVAAQQSRLLALNSTLSAATAQTGAACQVLLGAIWKLQRDLDPEAIEVKFSLPSKFPSFLAGGSPTSVNYTNFLSQTDSSVNVLAIFVGEGVAKVMQLGADNFIPATDVARTILKIDTSYTPDATATSAAATVQSIIVAATPKSLVRSVAGAPQRVDPFQPMLSISTLLARISSMNRLGWVMLLIVSALGIIYTVVLKPGFGLPQDYLICVTTAFGIPLVGGSIIPSQIVSVPVSKVVQPVVSSTGGVGVGI